MNRPYSFGLVFGSRAAEGVGPYNLGLTFCGHGRPEAAPTGNREVKPLSTDRERAAMAVSRNSIILNALLGAIKLFAGLFAHSAAMVSDAADSFADIVSTVVAMIGVRMSGKKADKEHPYGHERMECVASIILAALLAGTGLMIGYESLRKALNAQSLETPGLIALAAAVVSIVVKECMFRYKRKAAQRIGSGAIMADAWNNRTDALSSVGSFLGILGARLGLPVLDPLAGIVICAFILKTAYGIFMDAIGKLTDRAAGDATVEALRALVLAQSGVIGVDRLRTRLFGERIYVDVEILYSGKATLDEAHDAAQRVHDAIEEGFPKVKHCMVHVNPSD